MEPSFIDGFLLPAEEPIFRGSGKGQPHLLCAERRIQCRELRAAGWSIPGLAQLYAISKTGITRLIRRKGTHAEENAKACKTDYSYTLAQKIEEALILIRLDCWDDPKGVRPDVSMSAIDSAGPRLVEIARAEKARRIAEGIWPWPEDGYQPPANKPANER